LRGKKTLLLLRKVFKWSRKEDLQTSEKEKIGRKKRKGSWTRNGTSIAQGQKGTNQGRQAGARKSQKKRRERRLEGRSS